MINVILSILLVAYILSNLWSAASGLARKKHLDKLKIGVIQKCGCIGDVYWLDEYPRGYDCELDLHEYIFVEEYNNRRRHIFVSTDGFHVHEMPWRVIDGINDVKETITEE